MVIDMFPTGLAPRARVPALTFPFTLRGRAVLSARASLRVGSAPFVESLDYDAALAHAQDWQRLAERALEKNVFAEPACAVAAAQHFAGAHRPRFLFVWSGATDGKRGELLAVCPIHVPGRLESRRLTRTWTNEHMPLGTPLLDHRRATTGLDAIATYLRRETPATAGIVFHALPRHGATVKLLRDWAHDRALECRSTAPSTGMLSHGAAGRDSIPLAGDVDGIVAAFGCRRQALERMGAVSFRALRQPSDIRFATEEFFALDATARRGRGDAILSRTETTTFVRALTRMLAATGTCRIDRLAVDDRSVGLGIVITGPNGDYVWKIATDRALAEFGIQGQLVLSHVRADPGAPALVLADARPAIDRGERGAEPWTRALPLTDVALAVSTDRNRLFTTAMRRSAAWRSARSAIGLA